MDLHSARAIAIDLIGRHGLTARGWGFAFDNARRRFGSCNYTHKRITLSRHLAKLNDESQVRDTILHEIAHALTPGAGHGKAWRAACARVGAAPRRCFSDREVVTPPRGAARYRMGCPRCGWNVERRRLTRRILVCKTCCADVIYEDRVAARRFKLVVEQRRWLVRAV